jgi:transposase-like protein
MPRTYDSEFRRRVVELVRSGRSVTAVCAELGLAEATVYRWKAQDLIDRGEKPGRASVERGELAAANRRIRELETQLELVKKAAALFEEGVCPKDKYPVIAELTGLGFSAKLCCRLLGWRRRVSSCGADDPRHKGIIERAHDYLERSFLPGRTFAGPDDFNRQLQDWLAVANGRTKRSLGCAPSERIAADKAAMLALPPVAPATGWRASTRLAGDHYVRIDSNDYSIHPAVIGRRIELIVNLDRVTALCDGRLVADHQRAWAWHQTQWRRRDLSRDVATIVAWVSSRYAPSRTATEARIVARLHSASY